MVRCSTMKLRMLVQEARKLVVPAETSKDPLPAFLAGFYKRHSGFGRYHPKVLNKEDSGSGKGHPWASQRGDDIHLFPKFWDLDKKAQDFAFAHELGHWVSSQLGTSKLIELAQSLGIDPWDSSKLPYGQFNMEEAFAEAFAEVHLNQTSARKGQPAWSKLVDMAVDELP